MYKINLSNFEGPLDLLLFFIRRDELDIYDIPISDITSEFMEYLALMERLDLEIAGDFILMASTLMQIKAKMLLPKEKDEKGEEIDPRMDLVNALLEYKRYKEMSEELSIQESQERRIKYRGNFVGDEKRDPDELDALLKNITIFDLIKAFKLAMEVKPEEHVHQVERFNVTIEEQMSEVLNKTDFGKELSFVELIKGMVEKLKIVVTFIALLELIKMGKIGLKESTELNNFIIYGTQNG
ncbi:MAG: segregation/condensation protein A [Melioribacteraceae bacterium]|jgi:segregation and condensation protein A|nr:segregation/condensation protein A [Melioribacteraceae bacterium]